MKVCPRCNSSNDERAAFCTHCGSHFVEPQYQAPPPVYQAPPPPVYQAPPAPVQEAIVQSNPVERKKKEFMAPMLIWFYSLILFFVFFPMIFAKNTFVSFGEFGYGLRQQIGAFYALKNGGFGTFGLIMIEIGFILAIASVIIAAAFSIAAIVITAVTNARASGLNTKLIKIFNICIFSVFTAIMLITIRYLTFNFMCAYTLAFYTVLINIKPEYSKDMLLQNEDRGRGFNALMMFFILALFTLCFSPSFSTNAVGINKSYNYFEIIISSISGLNTAASVGRNIILIIIPIIIIVLSISMFAYYFAVYVLDKKAKFLPLYIGMGINFSLSVFIGAYVRVETQLGTSDPMKFTWIFFVILVLTFVVAVTPLMLKAIYNRVSKKKAVTTETAQDQDQ